MSAYSSAPSIMSAWKPMQDSLAEFQSDCSSLDRLIESLFDELDRMRVEMSRKMRDLCIERGRVADREQQHGKQKLEFDRLTKEFNEQKRQFEVALGEIDELRRKLDEAKSGALSAGQSEKAITAELDELKRQRDLIQRQLAESQEERARLADVAGDAEGLREQLHRAQSEIARQRERSLSHKPADDAGQLVELEEERDALEAELEQVRGRTAELHEKVAEQKREMAHERAEMAEELRQLRRIVENQAELLAQRSIEPLTRSPALRQEPQVEKPVPAGDPVVNSVMAQFAKLQKDIAERRRRKA